LRDKKLVKLIVVPSGSAEGLARLVFGCVDGIVACESRNRVRVVKVTVHEGPNNSATYGKEFFVE
jgi:hypothetical protein